MATATLLVRHHVNDFGAWRSVYDEVEPLRQHYGCTAQSVLVDPSDKQEVFVIHQFPTVEQAEGFAGSTELKDAMGRAGIAGAPRIEIAVEV